MKTLSLTAVIAAIAAPVFAGSLSEPIVEPVMAVPPAPVVASGDWTGAYVGAQLGYGDISSTGGSDGNGAIGGVHAGYNYDFGSYVLGAEIDANATDIELSGGSGKIDSIARLKLKAGFDAGRTLVYATAGGAYANSDIGDGSGYFGGFGIDYQVTDSVVIGGEVLQHRFDSLAPGVNVDATTAALKVSYKF